MNSYFNHVVLQPTSICNLNCKYCYLPNRDKRNHMSVDVARNIAKSVAAQNISTPVSIIWHGGEPLASGTLRFKNLLMEFEDLRKLKKIEHHIQTNGTLINEEWCSIIKDFQIKIGVSLDGPKWANERRVNWADHQMYDRILSGIEALKRNEIPFSIISVVTADTIEHATDLYNYFASLGCTSWNINIEEIEGVNKGTVAYVDDSRVKQFWVDLFNTWKSNQTLEIREIRKVLGYANFILNCEKSDLRDTTSINPFPTVAYNGDVTLISPELADTKSEVYSNFCSGNVLEKSLTEIIEDGQKNKYVLDNVRAVELCKDKCKYYGFCKGGTPSNRFFEHGKIDVMETAFCRNSEQRLFDAVMDNV